MKDRQMWNEVAERIGQAIGEKFEMIDRKSVSGGCINQTYLALHYLVCSIDSILSE